MNPLFFFLPLISALIVLPAAAVFDPQLPACNQHSDHSKVFTFFMHDDLDVTPIASAFTVVPALKTINGGTNRNGFGAIAQFDDAVTEEADVNSKQLGRSRGFYMFNSINDTGAALEIQFTVIFGDGSEFPGSTLRYQGYDKIDNAEREISIVGGTGVFRLARGWAVITTQSLNGGAANLNIKTYVYYGCNAQGDSAAMNVSPIMEITSLFVTLSFILLFKAPVFYF